MKIKKITYYFFALLLGLSVAACSNPKHFTRDFYETNEKVILNLRNEYTRLYNQKPFALLFEDRSFENIGVEIITDSIKYIYHFNIKEEAFIDTLNKYNYDATKILALISGLQKIQCTWITKLDYYENFNARYLVLMAIRNKALNSAFKGESYCTLAFFDRPQPVDKDGKFLDRSDRKRRRMINDYELKVINNQVGYAITRKYR